MEIGIESHEREGGLRSIQPGMRDVGDGCEACGSELQDQPADEDPREVAR